MDIHKYPRTPHLEGSRQQPGDEDLAGVPFQKIAHRFLVIEEKMDGANAAISFDETGQLKLQSRGHFLTGGPRERHFTLLKAWAPTVADRLRPILGTRFILYGEWLYAKHTEFYDQLPHYFLEFDVLDLKTATFLSTDRRHEMLADTGIFSVPVLRKGSFSRLREMTSLVGNSLYKSDRWEEHLRVAGQKVGMEWGMIARQTDRTRQMEGLYIKVEDNGTVIERYKFVRSDFMTSILNSESHWLDRPIIENRLAEGSNLYGVAS